MNSDEREYEPREFPRELGPPARFRQRWHLVGAGLSNVWKFGNLELPAASGRLLLRGGNGVGKTTTLEALAPYLLDLNAARMSAGKARTTNLSSLMREGATGRRRYGYAWLTLADAHQEIWSFGVRIQYSDGASPPTKVVPFAVPGKPLHDLKLHGIALAPITSEQFIENVTARGGEVFEPDDAYQLHLAARLFNTADRRQLDNLTQRLRHVRNPAILSDLSPQAAADALRASLPGVDEEVINATAEALAESDATREAFNRDKEAAELLEDFSVVWCAHVADVLSGARSKTAEAIDQLKVQQGRIRSCNAELSTAAADAEQAKRHAEDLATQLSETNGEIDALEKHESYKAAGRLDDLRRAGRAERQTADTALRAMRDLAQGATAASASLQRELENITEDLNEQCARAVQADRAAETGPLLTWRVRRRTPLRAGETTVEAGDALDIQGDGSTLRLVASR